MLLIAIENGELESAQQLNLLFLTAMIGDKKLLEKGIVISTREQEQPKLHQRSQKILTKIGDISTVKFNPKYGPISEESLNEQINNN